MMRQTLDAGLPELGLDLPESTRQTLCDFGAAVIKQNEVMNLTAITQPDQVAKLHLLDSLTVLTAADLRGKKVIDVGCGAGFPGVPLAIASGSGAYSRNIIGIVVIAGMTMATVVGIFLIPSSFYFIMKLFRVRIARKTVETDDPDEIIARKHLFHEAHESLKG